MGRIVKNLQDEFVQYHSCGVIFRNGSNVLVNKKRPCTHPILNCFWMDPKLVKGRVSTRKQERERSITDKTLFREYAKNPNLKFNYYSTDDDSDSDYSYSDNSDDETLIIDEKNTENETEDQIPGTRTPEQTPSSTAEVPDQTPDNK